MSNKIKKRIQIFGDKGTMESAEYIIKKAGLSPTTLISALYVQIAKTGKIPLSLEATPEELAQAKLIAASYNLPSVKVNNSKTAKDFLDDDGGY